MLKVCLIKFKGNWNDHLPFIELSYNNNYHSSILMVPFEELMVGDVDLRLRGLRFDNPNSLVPK